MDARELGWLQLHNSIWPRGLVIVVSFRANGHGLVSNSEHCPRGLVTEFSNLSDFLGRGIL